MPLQFSPGVRNARLDAIETTTGTAPKLRIYTGTPPSDCTQAATGTLLATLVLPSDWMAAASAGSKAILNQPWSGNAGTNGTAGYFRIWDSALVTCHIQGTVYQLLQINTSASSAQWSDQLTFTSTAGVAVNMLVSGTNVPAGAYVMAVTATTVTLSIPISAGAGVASGTQISFTGDLQLDNTNIANNQTINVTTFTLTDGNG